MYLSAPLLARKIKKRDRYNKILNAMREPITCMQLEKKFNFKTNSMTTIVANFKRDGYVILVGKASNDTLTNRVNVWQAVKFDYFEEGVDYEYFTRLEKEEESLSSEPPVGLESAVYVHNANHAYFAKKYQEQGQQARREWKSPKVYAGALGEIF